MNSTKKIVLIVILCVVQQSACVPMSYDIPEGRGIGSTLWGWITYPFSWWSSESPEPLPSNDQLIGSTTLGPYDSIEVGNRNITVWCNDQTCTTQKCDKFGCKNKTCNIYDTDMSGECREFNTEVKPEEPVTSKPAEVTTQDNVIESSSTKAPDAILSTTTIKESTPVTNDTVEQRPIELEAMLSEADTKESDEKKVY